MALKISTASSEALNQEASILQSLQRCTASKYIVELYDVFTHDGPNGSHLCIVTELLGPSVETVISDYHSGGERLDRHDIIRLAKQLLLGISATHEAGFAHGGKQASFHENYQELMDSNVDISGANVVFTASKLVHLSEHALFDVIGYPESRSLFHEDGAPLGRSLPKHLVRKASWDDWTDEDEEDIRLIDWGEAFPLGQPRSQLAQPSDLKAPETILTGTFDHRVDLWRAGCVVSKGAFRFYIPS